MTTIITVHGTGAASDKDAGDAWWQNGSEFQGEIDKLVAGTDGPVEWTSFHWNGANSETSRRDAGKRLYKYLRDKYEKEGRPYHLIGHSHGGSVISEALRHSTSVKARLKKLQSWTTVASPFLRFKKKPFFFQRIPLIGQVFFLLAAAYMVAVVYGGTRSFCEIRPTKDGYCWIVGLDSLEVEKIIAAGIASIEVVSPPEELREWGSVEISGDHLTFTPAMLRTGLSAHPSQRPNLFELLNPNAGHRSESPSPRDFFVRTFEFQRKGSNFVLQKDPSSETPVEVLFVQSFAHFYTSVDMCHPEALALWGIDREQAMVQTACNVDYEGEKKSGFTSLIRGHVNPVLEFRITSATKRILNVVTELDFRFTACGRFEGDKFAIDPTSNTVEQTCWGAIGSHAHQLLNTKTLISIQIIYYALCTIPLWLLTYLIWRSQGGERVRYSRRFHRQLEKWYGRSWTCLYHREDEAINAIANITKLKSDIAPKTFLVGPLKIVLVVAFAGLFLWNASAVRAPLLHLNSLLHDESPTLEKNVAGALLKMTQDSRPVFQELLQSTAIEFYGADGLVIWDSPFSETLPEAIWVVFGMVLFVLIVFYTTHQIERRIVGPIARRLFNRRVDAALLNIGFGQDTMGEVPLKALANPHEFDQSWRPLPETPHDALRDFVRKYLAGVVEKMRGLLGLSADQSDPAELSKISEILTWNELIHTSYFSVPEIRWIIAESLASHEDIVPQSEFDTSSRQKAQEWIAVMRPVESDR